MSLSNSSLSIFQLYPVISNRILYTERVNREYFDASSLVSVCYSFILVAVWHSCINFENLQMDLTVLQFLTPMISFTFIGILLKIQHTNLIHKSNNKITQMHFWRDK